MSSMIDINSDSIAALISEPSESLNSLMASIILGADIFLIDVSVCIMYSLMFYFFKLKLSTMYEPSSLIDHSTITLSPSLKPTMFALSIYLSPFGTSNQ